MRATDDAPRPGTARVSAHEQPAPLAPPLPLHVFRAGTHTALGGRAVTFSEADLTACAASYDPAVHEAPIVVGHPKLDAPAYGWVGSVSASGGGLEVEPRQVEPAFAEMVREGRFKKVSAAFYLPGSSVHPLGPDAQAPYLKHVGFLGAAPPALKGLRPAEFAAGEDGVAVVEFAADELLDGDDLAAFAGSTRPLLRMMRRLREWLSDQFGAETADRVVSSDELDWLIEDEARAELIDELHPAPPAPAFAEPAPPPAPDPDPMSTPEQKTAAFAERERQIEEREAALRRREEEAATRDRERLHQEHVAFAEALADANARILPRHVDVVAAALDALTGTEGTVAFGEEDAELPLADAFRRFLSELPEHVAFGERSAPEAAGNVGTAEFAAPVDGVVDPARLAVHQKAVAHQREHGGTYSAAVQAVS